MVFSTLTPSRTREGESPPWPQQAPGFAQSLGQGSAAAGSGWWFFVDGGHPVFPWGERKDTRKIVPWGPDGCGSAVGTGA